LPFAKSSAAKSADRRIRDRGVTQQVVTTQAANGAVSGTVVGHGTGTQVISAGVGTAIEGAAAIFPPDSLAKTKVVTLAPGLSLNTPAFYRTLGITAKAKAVGSPLLVTTREPMDAEQAFFVDLKIPFGNGNVSEADLANMVVLYSVNKNKAGGLFAGVFSRNEIQIVDGKARISTSYFGTFQLALMDSVLSPVTEKLVTREEIAARLYFNSGVKVSSFGNGHQNNAGFQGWVTKTSDPKVSTSTNTMTSGYQDRPILGSP
jgi:hypothetical protein